MEQVAISATIILYIVYDGIKALHRARTTRLQRMARQAVQQVKSSFSKPLLVHRMQSTVDSKPRSFGDAYGALRLSNDEKQEAKKLALQFLGMEAQRAFWLRCSTGEADDLIEDAYHTSPAVAPLVLANLSHVRHLISR